MQMLKETENHRGLLVEKPFLCGSSDVNTWTVL